jgi:hypothetical protein
VIFAFQLIAALRLTAHNTPGHQSSVAIVLVVSFLFGVARSWELIGGPRISMASELRALFGRGDDGDG